MKIFILVSYLLCLIVEGLGMGHSCKEPVPENCRNNPRISLSKNDMYYSLSLCSNGQCLPANHQEWIECSDVCEMCRSVLGPNSCTSNKECEQQVDSFLNSYCTSALPSTATVTQPGPTTTVTSTQVQAAMTVTKFQTTTRITTTTVTVTPASSSPASSSQSGQATVNVDNMDNMAASPRTSSNVQNAEFALAALFGLAIIVLMAVIIGWVWTYLVLKKKARETNNGIIQTSFPAGFDAKKYFKNPAYEGVNDTIAPPNSQTELEESLTPEQMKFQKVKYDRIVVVPPSQVENGRRYDVLNRQPTFQGADPSAVTPPQRIQNGNKVEGQNSSIPLQYSYSQLSHQNTTVENHYCTTRLAE